MADLYIRDLNDEGIKEVRRLILKSNRADLKKAIENGEDITIGRHYEIDKFRVA